MDNKITNAQLAKIMAETVKIQAEARWYPLEVGAALAIAVITITNLFL